MQLLKPTFNIATEIDGEHILRHLEKAIRKAYKSEDKINAEDSHYKMLNTIMQKQHLATLEHFSVSVEWVTNIGISREANRHRLASIVESSTRYCNFSKDKFGGSISYVMPAWFFTCDCDSRRRILINAYAYAEKAYMELMDAGAKPQEAREVLPLGTKTEEMFTANLREWRHIFALRCAKPAHPNIRQLMLPLLHAFYTAIPLVYDDLWEEFKDDYADFEAKGLLAKEVEDLIDPANIEGLMA